MASRTPCGPTSESGAPSVGPANMQPFNGIPNTLTRIDTPRERARTPPMPESPANAGFTPTVPSADGEPTVETDHGESPDMYEQKVRTRHGALGRLWTVEIGGLFDPTHKTIEDDD